MASLPEEGSPMLVARWKGPEVPQAGTFVTKETFPWLHGNRVSQNAMTYSLSSWQCSTWHGTGTPSTSCLRGKVVCSQPTFSGKFSTVIMRDLAHGDQMELTAGNPTRSLNLAWQLIRSPVVLPFLQGAVYLCATMSIMLFVERLYMAIVILFVKILKKKQYTKYRLHDMRDDLNANNTHPTILVQIPMYNEKEVWFYDSYLSYLPDWGFCFPSYKLWGNSLKNVEYRTVVVYIDFLCSHKESWLGEMQEKMSYMIMADSPPRKTLSSHAEINSTPFLEKYVTVSHFLHIYVSSGRANGSSKHLNS